MLFQDFILKWEVEQGDSSYAKTRQILRVQRLALERYFMGRNWLHMQSHQHTELLNQLSEIRASETKANTYYGQNSPFPCSK